MISRRITLGAVSAFLGMLLWFVPSAASAQDCYVGNDPEINFGQLAGTPTQQVDATGTLRITCLGSYNQQVKVCARLANGSPDPSLLPQRRMARAGDRLNYQIHSDAARSQIWGAGGATPAFETIITLDTWLFFFSAGQVDVPLYGRLQGGQTGIGSGNYQSTLNGSSITWTTNLNRSCNAITSGPVAFSATVRATVTSSCTIAANNLSFGSHSQLAAAVAASTSLGVTCTVGTPYTVRMDGGTTANNVADRRMGLNGTGPAAQGVAYQLRHTSPSGPLWGDGTSGTSTLGGTGTGGSQTLPVYGRVLPQAVPLPGQYEDTVTVTVQY